MRSGPVKHDSMAQDAVDQEPIRIHMAFSEPGEISFETPRENDLLHSRLRYATASRAVLKRRTLPSRSSRRDKSSARRAAAFNS